METLRQQAEMEGSHAKPGGMRFFRHFVSKKEENKYLLTKLKASCSFMAAMRKWQSAYQKYSVLRMMTNHPQIVS